MSHFFRTYVSGFFSPTPLIGLSLFIGLLLLWRYHDISTRLLPLTLFITFFCLFGMNSFAGFLLNRTENVFAEFNPQTVEKEKLQFVVVLGGGVVPKPGYSLATQLTPRSLVRLVEGIRILREMPNAKLVLSGKGGHLLSEAEAMRTLAIQLGVSEERILIENKSLNTFDHPLNLKAMLGNEEFVLVTSALHMPRAVAAFHKAGLFPIPAPTGHSNSPKMVFTKGDDFSAIDAWSAEFWSTAWGRIKGVI